MQPAENWRRRDRGSEGTDGGPRRVQRQAPVRTFGIVVCHEFGKDRPEVLLVEEDHVVEALVPQGPVDSLGNRIRAGRPHRAEQGLNAQASGPPGEVPTVGGVPVAQ